MDGIYNTSTASSTPTIAAIMATMNRLRAMEPPDRPEVYVLTGDAYRKLYANLAKDDVTGMPQGMDPLLRLYGIPFEVFEDPMDVAHRVKELAEIGRRVGYCLY